MGTVFLKRGKGDVFEECMYLAVSLYLALADFEMWRYSLLNSSPSEVIFKKTTGSDSHVSSAVGEDWCLRKQK